MRKGKSGVTNKWDGWNSRPWSYGWWGRVSAVGQTEEFLQCQDVLQSRCHGNRVCGRCSYPTMWMRVHFCWSTVFPEAIFSSAKLFSWHISKLLCFPTSTTEQTVPVFHRFLSTFSLWWEAQQKLSSGRQLLLLLHARRQKWEDAKKRVK